MTQLGEAVSPPEVDKPEEKEEEIKSVKIRISMFFDGTLNNKFNTEHRLSDDDIYKENKKTDNSYENDLTNVAIMEKYIADAAGYDNTLSCYIEGPGTINDEDDKFFGYALGTGKSGVVKKVRKAIDESINKIKNSVKDTELIIEEISIDVFGFSRGAAGARYFIHEALDSGKKPIKEELISKGFKVKKIKIKFAGLYDTVSSHGVIYSNDVSDLKLRSVFHADKVIQLAAAEEHRERFSLTTIDSAGFNGRQIYLPGVHSDIGGSYVDGSSEEFIIYKSYSKKKAENEMDRLIDSGWYKKNEINLEVKKQKRHHTSITKAKLLVSKKNIGNKYSRIPLNIMGDFAGETGINLNGEFSSQCVIPGDLSKAKQIIDKYISDEKKSEPSDWSSNDEWHKELRSGYLHFSSKYSIGLNPRFNNNVRVRKLYHG